MLCMMIFDVWRFALLGPLLTAALPLVAQAQLRLPGGLPQLPAVVERPLDRLQRGAEGTLGTTTGTAVETLRGARRAAEQSLLRNWPGRVEADPNGAPVRRGELLLVDPGEALLQAAQAQGFTLLRSTMLEGLDLRQVVLAPPNGLSLADALARLRALDPGLEADYHHLYRPSGAAASTARGASEGPPNEPAGSPGAAPAAPVVARVGLIDGGVDAQHPSLRSSVLQRWGCEGLPAAADAHGTAVASLLVGRDADFTGALPGATLFSADVYCGAPDGGGAEAVAQALAWMARQRVGVVNISLVGPANRLLERVVDRLAARGHLLVAAVGNDGPAAPPLYPAAYAGVLAIAGVTPSRRVLPEAGQGPHVAFAAPGADIAAARAGSAGYRVVRGTSFAAPLVAGGLAGGLPQPDIAARQRLLLALQAVAHDLGARGRDPVYGHGLVAEDLRVPPQRVQAAAP